MTTTIKLTEPQERLLSRMAEGWLCRIYFDDPRARVFNPTYFAHLPERVHGNTIMALLNRGFIRIIGSDDVVATYAISVEGMMLAKEVGL